MNDLGFVSSSPEILSLDEEAETIANIIKFEEFMKICNKTDAL